MKWSSCHKRACRRISLFFTGRCLSPRWFSFWFFSIENLSFVTSHTPLVFHHWRPGSRKLKLYPGLLCPKDRRTSRDRHHKRRRRAVATLSCLTFYPFEGGAILAATFHHAPSGSGLVGAGGARSCPQCPHLSEPPQLMSDRPPQFRHFQLTITSFSVSCRGCRRRTHA